MYSYLITDPKYYSNNPEEFRKTLNKTLERFDVQIACFRDKVSSNKVELATIFVQTCKEQGVENILINGDINLAVKLNVTGVHLTSTQFEEIQLAKSKNLYVIISCHSFEDIKKAQDLKADAVTFSPIFSTPEKGKTKGVEVLKNAIEKFDIKIIALGGIVSIDEIAQIRKAKAYAFASIRWFV